jgi:hydrogenase/urease accessory protein HupE
MFDGTFGQNTGAGSMEARSKEVDMLGTGRRLACAIGMALLTGSTAFAHPGHGRSGGDFGLPHYVTEPEHLLLAVPVLLLVALAAGHLGRKRAKG